MAATLNVNRGVSTVTSGSSWTGAGAVAAGAVGAALATEYARSEIYDVQFMGGDVLYAAAMAVAIRTVMSGRMSRNVAYGAIAGGIISEAREQGFL